MLAKTESQTHISIFSPYNKAWISRARELNGKWKSTDKSWVFPLSRADEVESACREIFGAAPAEPGAETVTIRITAKRDIEQQCAGVAFSGREVVAARGRDTGAFPSEGCALISGAAISSGSRQYWKTVVREGAVIEIEDFLAEAAVETADWAVVIVGKTVKRDDELMAEKARLLARIAEIDALLES